MQLVSCIVLNSWYIGIERKEKKAGPSLYTNQGNFICTGCSEEGDFRPSTLLSPCYMSHSIPSNQNSQRASSRKNRVYTFHSFLSETYSDATKILDVAGGRGDLSFLLRNVNGVDSIIADPRVPNFTRLIKSINFLFQHPEEAKVRAVEGRMTYQPLAKLIPHLFERHICAEVGGHKSGAAQISIPKNLRLHVDGNLVKVLQSVMLFHNEEPLNSPSWDEYWTNETKRIASNKSYYGGTSPKQKAASSYESNQIEDSRMALKTFMSLNLIVGFHPDQVSS